MYIGLLPGTDKQKSNVAAVVILKTTKIAISQQRFDRSSLNLARKMGLLTVLAVKKFEFQNPRWRTAATLKTVKSSYLCNRSTNFDEIWHGDACWSPAPNVIFNFRQYYMADSR